MSPRPISTSLTRLLGINVPIVSAPMAGAVTAELAAQVTLGGGFGFIAAGYDSPDYLRQELTTLRARFPDADPLPIGVGFLCWQLEQMAPESAHALLDLALSFRPRAIWLSFGRDIPHWIAHVRAHAAQTVIFVQVTSLAEALTAVREWRVDVLVTQGTEAGGHGSARAPGVFTLLSDVLAALPSPDAPPVLAAGGLATGAHVAALLTLGAAGAVLGTRFLLTPESRYSAGQKAALARAPSADATVRTRVFDALRGTTGWPGDVDGRALRNATVDDADAGAPHAALRERFVQGTKEDDASRMLVWCGAGVGHMPDIVGARDVVEAIHGEAVRRLEASQQLLGA